MMSRGATFTSVIAVQVALLFLANGEQFIVNWKHQYLVHECSKGYTYRRTSCFNTRERTNFTFIFTFPVSFSLNAI